MRRRLFKNLITAPCTEAVSEPTDRLEAAGEELRGAIARTLGRSLAIREVDAGSCNGCDLVIRGCPPTPVQLLQGLLWLMTRADQAADNGLSGPLVPGRAAPG